MAYEVQILCRHSREVRVRIHANSNREADVKLRGLTTRLNHKDYFTRVVVKRERHPDAVEQI